MQQEAGTHGERLNKLIEIVKESEELDNNSIEKYTQETVEKTSQMMKAYLGDDPNELDALEFLSIAEGGELTHYEVLRKLASRLRNKKFATGVTSILLQERKHMQMCIELAQQASIEAA